MKMPLCLRKRLLIALLAMQAFPGTKQAWLLTITDQSVILGFRCHFSVRGLYLLLPDLWVKQSLNSTGGNKIKRA